MTRRRGTPRPRRGARRAFTVIEVMVSISVFTIGVLSLAGTSAALTRMIGASSRSTHASFAEEQVMERLRADAAGAGGCASLTNGVDTTGPYVRSWTVTSAGAESRVTLVVRYQPRPGITRSDTLTTSLSC